MEIYKQVVCMKEVKVGTKKIVNNQSVRVLTIKQGPVF